MSRTISIRWAALALAIAWSSLQAQTQNEIVSTGFTASFYPPSFAYVTPGEIVTLFTTPLGVPDAVATGFPLPTTLSGLSVLVRVIGASDATGYPTSLPILRIDHQGPYQLPAGPACPTGPDSAFCSNTRITVEIPTEGVCYTPPSSDGAHPCGVQPYVLLPPLLVLNVKVNGVTGPDLPLLVQEFAPHFLNSCDSVFGPQSSSTCHALITHADGTTVSNASPAKVGEAITLYAVGLDSVPASLAPTGYPLLIPISADVGGLLLSYTAAATGPPGNPQIFTVRQILIQADWAGFTPGFIGLGQINFTVPSIPDKLSACSDYGNVALASTNETAGTVYICVQQ
jgi:hypothetical protein